MRKNGILKNKNYNVFNDYIIFLKRISLIYLYIKMTYTKLEGKKLNINNLIKFK